MRALRLLTISGAMACLAVAAFADALEGKKSSADILAATTTADWREIPADDLLVIEIEGGKKVHVALSPAFAPKHVEQVKKLAREGFYDGLSFYRVIDGFVAQGGDPFSEKKIKKAKKKMKAEFEGKVGEGASFVSLADEDGFAPEVGFIASIPTGYDPKTGTAWHIHCAGAFAFGREDEKDTASTEFYVALQPQRYLDRNMSVFGRVIDGMDHLQGLRRVEPPESKEDDIGEKIVSVKIAADIPEGERAAFEILDSARPVFAEYVEARRNRPEPFFHFRADHLDVCQLPVPVRRKESE